MIGSETDLRARFGEIHPLAIQKTRPAFDKYSRQFITMSPFLVISTANAEGKADLSPRGDPPGFIHIVNELPQHLARVEELTAGVPQGDWSAVRERGRP